MRHVENLFQEFRSNPSSESLVALLRGNQDRIYNICYQVLHHPQDAEDASQEVLLELAEGCTRVHDVHAFKSWLYRVAMNTALNHKKSRFARAELARRSAGMSIRHGQSISDEDTGEVIDAIARLDDESRCLILEHYFEKTTLEDLAKRERLSVTGIWKRLERAKGKLRQALIGAGFTLSTSSVTHALEAVAPVSAPASLIGGAVISKAALVAAGGFAVASKSVISGATVVLGLCFLTVGAGGGYWVGTNRNHNRNVTERQTEHSGDASPVSNGTQPADQLDVAALRRENERMRLRLEQLEGNTSTEGDVKLRDLQLAQEVYEAMIAPDFHSMKDKKQWMATMGKLAKLKPTMAAFFIEKYRSETAPGARTIGLQLAIACGGPEASALLKELFGNPAVSKQDRSFAAIALTSDALVGRPSQLSVDSELWAIAERNRASSEFVDRLSAVGIFGMRDSAESRTALLGFCSQDSAVHVRITALRALARIGDRQTYDQLLASGMAILESLPPQPPGPQGHEQQSPEVRLRQAFDQTLKELRERFQLTPQ